MDSNIHSANRRGQFAALVAAINDLDHEDLDRVSDVAAAEQVMALRPLVEQLQGQWLKRLAVVDGRGATGAEQDRRFGSTAGWLRARLRMGRHGAATAVRTARALFCGPLAATGQALCAGELSAAHAEALAANTQLPDQVTSDAESTLLDAARRLDPGQLRRAVQHLRYMVDPEGADRQAQRRYERRGLWFSPTVDDMIAVGGQLHPEAGQTLLAALEPLARPADANDTRSGSQRNADALTELARRSLEGGQLPKAGGVRPQLSVVVDLASLQGQPGGIGGDAGWAAPLPPEACRRLACDGSVTRVLVSRGASGPGRELPDLAAGATRSIRWRRAWRGGCGRPWPPCRRSWGALPACPSTSGGRPGWSARPSTGPWPCGTVVVSSPAVAGRWPGAKPITSSTGWMAARPTWRTWPWCAGNIIGPSMTAAGDSSGGPTGASPPPHHTDNIQRWSDASREWEGDLPWTRYSRGRTTRPGPCAAPATPATLPCDRMGRGFRRPCQARA
jgi:hypothetical protein